MSWAKPIHNGEKRTVSMLKCTKCGKLFSQFSDFQQIEDKYLCKDCYPQSLKWKIGRVKSLEEEIKELERKKQVLLESIQKEVKEITDGF